MKKKTIIKKLKLLDNQTVIPIQIEATNLFKFNNSNDTNINNKNNNNKKVALVKFEFSVSNLIQILESSTSSGELKTNDLDGYIKDENNNDNNNNNDNVNNNNNDNVSSDEKKNFQYIKI